MSSNHKPIKRPFALRDAAQRSISLRIFALAITPAVLLMIELFRVAGKSPPAPFLMIFLGIAVSTTIGGLRYGLWNAIVACVYIFYATSIGFGPHSLTGNLLNAMLGCSIGLILAIMLGRSRDQILAMYKRLELHDLELIKANAELERRVASRTRELRHVSNTMLTAVEQERRHIAGELHDQLGQTATALKLSLHMLTDKVVDHVAIERLGRCINMTDTVIQQIRTLALSLRPPMLDTLGLEDTLRWYIEDQLKLDLNVQMEIADLSEKPDPIIESSCFRIAQESLTNIARHANADTVKVELSENGDGLKLCIEDDGVGYDMGVLEERRAHGVSFGITGMIERASLAGGKLTITSSPKNGTRISAFFPAWKINEVTPADG